MTSQGVYCWIDEHNILPGDDIFDRINDGIRNWDKILFCASEASLTSWWVDDEIVKAIQKEQDILKVRGEKVLAIIPIDLDGYMLSDNYQGGYKSTLTRRLALGFRDWTLYNQVNPKFDEPFKKLLRALRSDGKGRIAQPVAKL